MNISTTRWAGAQSPKLRNASPFRGLNSNARPNVACAAKGMVRQLSYQAWVNRLHTSSSRARYIAPEVPATPGQLARQQQQQQQAAAASSSASPQEWLLHLHLSGAQAQASAKEVPKPAVVPLTFRLHYHCYFGQNLYLLGSTRSVGGWDVDQAVPLQWSDGDLWSAKVDLEAGSRLQYKYLVKNADGSVARWQEGLDVVLDLSSMQLSAEEGLLLHESWCKSYRTIELWPAGAAAAPSTVDLVAAGDSHTTFELLLQAEAAQQAMAAAEELSQQQEQQQQQHAAAAAASNKQQQQPLVQELAGMVLASSLASPAAAAAECISDQLAASPPAAPQQKEQQQAAGTAAAAASSPSAPAVTPVAPSLLNITPAASLPLSELAQQHPKVALSGFARALVSVRRTSRKILRPKGPDAAADTPIPASAAGAGGDRLAAGTRPVASALHQAALATTAMPTAALRQQSMDSVRSALQLSLRMSQQVADPSHPELLRADRQLAAAARGLAMIPYGAH